MCYEEQNNSAACFDSENLTVNAQAAILFYCYREKSWVC